MPCCLKRHAKLTFCRLFGGVFLTLAVCAAAMAADVTLAWDPVAASDIAGYKLHYGTASRRYSGVIDAGKTTTCKVPNLTAGKTWYFAATAYTTSGKQSGYSNEVVYTVPTTVPASPKPKLPPTTSTGTTTPAQKPVRTVTDRNTAAAWQLTIQKSGSGNVATSPTATTYPGGTTVKLFASPNAGWVFDGWAGMVANTESPATSIVMNRDQWITATFMPDQDRDSIADTIESGRNGSNPGYDGNADGVPDRLQPQVATLFSYTMGYYATLSSATPVKFAYCKGVVPPRPAALPGGTSLPMGTFNMQLRDVPAAGRRATIIFSLPDSVPYVNSWYAYGPTADNTQPHWYQFMYDRSTGTGAVIAGRKVTLYYKDGARGDDDLTPNGRILSRGGPATKK